MFRRYNAAWLITAILHCIIAFAGIYLHSSLTADSQEYLNQAENLREHLTFYCGDLTHPIQPEWYSLRPPGYGLFLAFFSWGELRIILPVIIQVIISIITLYIAWKCSTIISGKRANAFLFLLPLTAFIPQLIYSGMIMSEILFQCAWTLAFCAGVMLHHSGKIKWAFVFQVFLTIALLIKPVAWLLPLFFIPLLFHMIASEHYPRKLIWAMLIPLVVISMMFFRNYSLTGVAEFSSVSNKLLINYNVPPLLREEMGDAAAQREIDSVQYLASNIIYREKARLLREYSIAKITEAPFTYAGLHFKGLINFFFDSGRWEWRRYFNHPLPLRRDVDRKDDIGFLQNWTVPEFIYQIYCMAFNLILVFALLRFGFHRAFDVRDRRLLLVMVFYIALLTGPSASARFRIPVFPLQLIAWGCLIAGAGKIKPPASVMH
jgi:hypothetical protein